MSANSAKPRFPLATRMGRRQDEPGRPIHLHDETRQQGHADARLHMHFFPPQVSALGKQKLSDCRIGIRIGHRPA